MSTVEPELSKISGGHLIVRTTLISYNRASEYRHLTSLWGEKYIMKKLIILMAFMSCLTIILVACQSKPDAPNTVHMDTDTFLKSAITIKKGDHVAMENDSSEVHIINNGSWISGSAIPKKEAAAPLVNETIQGGQNYNTPPFNIAGTYHLYCTVHPGMELTVVVQ
jgi:plastocyanin